jgi:hypothetical protein
MRRSHIAIALMLSSAGALAQTSGSPVGTWKSNTFMHPDWPFGGSFVLNVTTADAQRAAGTFLVYYTSGGGVPNYCRNGPVSGTYNGELLKLSSPSSNLCVERIFELKVSGDRLAGKYIGSNSTPMELTFTRER